MSYISALLGAATVLAENVPATAKAIMLFKDFVIFTFLFLKFLKMYALLSVGLIITLITHYVNNNHSHLHSHSHSH